MDMKNILQNMDNAAAGKKPSAAGAEVNDMKAILESIQSVEECGMSEMPAEMPQEPEEKVSMNVTLNARGDAVEDLIKLMGGSGAPGAKELGQDDMPIMKKLPVPADMDKMAMAMAMDDDEEVEEAEGEWDNAPDEDYKDHEYMTKDLAGGMHKEKKSHPPASGGDNPMALEQSIKEQLLAALEEKYANDAQRKAVHASKNEKNK